MKKLISSQFLLAGVKRRRFQGLWRKIDAKTGRKSLEEKLKIGTARLAHKTGLACLLA